MLRRFFRERGNLTFFLADFSCPTFKHNFSFWLVRYGSFWRVGRKLLLFIAWLLTCRAWLIAFQDEKWYLSLNEKSAILSSNDNISVQSESVNLRRKTCMKVRYNRIVIALNLRSWLQYVQEIFISRNFKQSSVNQT